MSRKIFRNLVGKFDKIDRQILCYIATRKKEEVIIQTKVATELNIPITTLNYHFTKLKSGGYLNKQKGYMDKQNLLTDKTKKLLRNFKCLDKLADKKLRAHNLQITLHLSRVPIDFFKNKNEILKPFTNKKYRGLKAELNGCTILFYSDKKAVVNIKDIFATDESEILAGIEDAVSELCKDIELEYGVKVNDHKIATIKTMHVALLDSVIAESYILKNNANHKQGDIVVDKSHGRFELENENVKTAIDSIEVFVKYEDMAREIKELKKELEKFKNSLIDNNIDTESDDSLVSYFTV